MREAYSKARFHWTFGYLWIPLVGLAFCSKFLAPSFREPVATLINWNM